MTEPEGHVGEMEGVLLTGTRGGRVFLQVPDGQSEVTLSPTDARNIAKTLTAYADEAEAATVKPEGHHSEAPPTGH